MSTPRKTTRKVTPQTPFVPVFHKNGHRIEGLWQRGSRFYAQLRVIKEGRSRSTKIALREATSVAQAVVALEEEKSKNRKGELIVLKHAPKLVDAVEQFKGSTKWAEKSDSTKVSDKGYLDRWVTELGSERVDRIQTPRILAIRDKLSREGKHARTCNLYVGGLMQVLRFCHERGQLGRVPKFDRIRPPKPPRQSYLPDETFQALLDNCRPEVNKNAPQLSLFIRFLALTGAREQEATRIAWRDVNFKTRRLVIGADGKTKNHETRDLDMSDELIELLKEMEAKHPPDSQWLFPSPQRGDKDLHVRNFRGCLNAVRGTPRPLHKTWKGRQRKTQEVDGRFANIGFHTFRHLFISKCVMAGVDYMTIAEWVGHKDGGVLIGQVYGHLSQDHKAQVAKNLSLFKKPENVVPLPQQAAG
jgi:integrase